MKDDAVAGQRLLQPGEYERNQALRAHNYVTSREERAEAMLRDMKAQLELVIAKLQTKIEPRLLTLDQAASYMGRTRRAVERLVDRQAIPTIRMDSRVFIDRRDLDRMIDDKRC